MLPDVQVLLIRLAPAITTDAQGITVDYNLLYTDTKKAELFRRTYPPYE
jgi:hypothetical protein